MYCFLSLILLRDVSVEIMLNLLLPRYGALKILNLAKYKL
jgi:hypothetical protein